MEKIKLEQAVLVEGRYDKIKLDSLLDALVIPVHGFSIFTDDELKELIKKLADERGLIILMDSDAAGFKIRGFIKSMVPPEKVKDVYIPDIMGKETRKRTASKEGKLGVEGIDANILREAFEKAGVIEKTEDRQVEKIEKHHFVEYGFSGGKDSSERRQMLYSKLDLPSRISTNSAISIINSMMTLEEFEDIAKSI